MGTYFSVLVVVSARTIIIDTLPDAAFLVLNLLLGSEQAARISPNTPRIRHSEAAEINEIHHIACKLIPYAWCFDGPGPPGGAYFS